MTQFNRETQNRVYPVFALALIGFAVGWLAFSAFGRPSVIVNTGMGGSSHSDPWAPSSDPSIASTTKVDNLDANTQVLARGNFRITSPTGPTMTSGAAAPSAIAPAGSVYYRTNGTQYTNTDGTGAGWTVVFQSGTFPPIACGGGHAISSIATTGVSTCDVYVNAVGDHLSLSGSTVSLAPIATARILGRTSAGPGNVEDLTGTQVTAMLDVVTTSVKGLVPTLPNDATKFLNGVGGYSVPAGTGVSSITAGQSITVTGTTTPTVALNFPTTACTAGQAVTSHNSAGTPSCSTFVNAAGTGLALTGSSLAVNIAGASCAAGSFVSALSATGTGTCTATTGADPGYYIVPGEGTCAFDGVANPVCGASLSGSTYDAGRDIAATTMSVTSGKRLKMRNYRIYVQGTLTVDGTIDVNGGNASGGSGGGKQDVNNTCGAGTNGGANLGAGTNAGNYIPYGIFPLNTASAASTGGGNGGNGPSAGRGGGGGGAIVPAVGTANGATSGTMNGGGIFSVDTSQLFQCRSPDGQVWSGGTGGGGGGQSIQGGSTCTAGGGGAGGGWLPIQAGTLAGTGGVISSDGGNGANGSGLAGTIAGCGGGGGGGGGILSLRFGSYSGSVTVHATGGGFGTGVSVGVGDSAASGGSGADGKVMCVNTSGGTAKPTGCP